MEFLKPDNLNNVWASGGDRLYPGDTKYASGWGVEIPPRQYFNEIDYKQDQMLAHINQHGIPMWDDETEYQAGKSYVQGEDGLIYKALTTHVNSNPVTDVSGKWEVAFVSPSQATQVATATQARALTANNVFMSPLQVSNAFSGSNQNLSQTGGFQRLPGGLLLQWGQATANTDGGVLASFPTPFSSSCFSVCCGLVSNPTGSAEYVQITSTTLTNFSGATIINLSTAAIGQLTFTYFAIGQ